MPDDPQVGNGKNKKHKDRHRKSDDRSDAPAAQGGWHNGKFEFPLSKPILAYGDEVKKIILREPTGEDHITVGNPVKVNMLVEPVDINFNDRLMAEMIARLASIPLSSVAQMTPKEISALSWIIAPFFLPA